MSNNEPLTFEEALSNLNTALAVAGAQIADSLNEAAEQLRLSLRCEMRRFYVYEDGGESGQGVVFPDGTTIVQDYVTGALHTYDDPKRITEAGDTMRYVDGAVQ